MKIAYVAPYQGASLASKRPSLHNLSLGGRVKIQLIAELFQKSGHEVEIISQGPIDRKELRFYPSIIEQELFNPRIPIYYLSALPIRFVTGFWEGFQIQRILKSRHKERPYDAIVIYNMKRAQIQCAHYALERLGVPVILEYEDDGFVDVRGRRADGVIAKLHEHRIRRVLNSVSGVMAPSPYLLAQCPDRTPRLLVRAVVSNEILNLRASGLPKRNWVVFSGTLEGAQGLEQTVKAWRMVRLRNWELHIAGQGPLDNVLRKMAEGDDSIVFHGLLDREQNARLLCTARIGVNPQDVTEIPGNTFAFKIVEYLAAGNHVITTPRGAFESELEGGVTYIADNLPGTIGECLRTLIQGRGYVATAEAAAVRIYGPASLSRSLNALLNQVTAKGRAETGELTPAPQ
jgi:glycosyltransferase involved in cell wall biosynthesis